MMDAKQDIVIIGAGVIGMSIAWRLIRDGRHVTLIEPNMPGMGASYGNAGTIADYATIPVGTPSVLKNMPSLLFDANSPLSIPLGSIPHMLPWLARFAWQSLPRATARNARSLGQLLNNASQHWMNMARDIGAETHLHQRGCLYLYESEHTFSKASYEEQLRRHNGVELNVISANEVLKLEPKLQAFHGGAHYFPNATSIDDPGKLMQILAQKLKDFGALFIQDSALCIDSQKHAIRVKCKANKVDARTVVIAAGAYSNPLAASMGERIPLDTERGYHLEFDMDELPVSRPVCSAQRGFYASPMTGRLRIAGTVELGGLTRPPNPQRLDLLERGARELFPQLPPPSRSWMGFRPSVPHSVPIIQPTRRSANVIMAFGHGHLGVTLAPATAERVTTLIPT